MGQLLYNHQFMIWFKYNLLWKSENTWTWFCWDKNFDSCQPVSWNFLLFRLTLFSFENFGVHVRSFNPWKDGKFLPDLIVKSSRRWILKSNILWNIIFSLAVNFKDFISWQPLWEALKVLVPNVFYSFDFKWPPKFLSS